MGRYTNRWQSLRSTAVSKVTGAFNKENRRYTLPTRRTQNC